MALEIERKFLLSPTHFKANINIASIPSNLIVQGYLLSTKELSIRVRITDEEKAELCIKTRISDTIRNEYEYEIPVDDGVKLLEGIEDTIRKRRYQLGDNMTVDEFLGCLYGLYLFEIEFESESLCNDWKEYDEYPMKNWIANDVTSDPTYLNANLFDKKYVDGNIVTK